MIAQVTSATLYGLATVPITIEVDLSNGLPGLTIVGLPDKSVDESRERVRSAVRASGATLPAQRITVNLAPADVKKEGPAFDLPIAVGILAAAGQIPMPPPDNLFIGELSLNGDVKKIRGVLAVAAEARRLGVTTMYVAPANAAEAALAEGPSVVPVPNLQALIDHFKQERNLVPYQASSLTVATSQPEHDFAEIRGQALAKRALEIAAAGGHNVMLSGPPGTGKTLLAKAMAGILPRLTRPEMLEVSKIYSVAGLLSSNEALVTERPWRNPHHSVSLAGLIGGGGWPRPGELTLAHRGVLFLDEIPQFPRHVLEAMRGPLEDRVIRISRAQHTLEFPTDCLVVASENPCPCGFATDPAQPCTCSPMAVERYRQRLSGPIRDRFDLTIEVPRLAFEQMKSAADESSLNVRERVEGARKAQGTRFAGVRINAGMGLSDIEAYCQLPPTAEALLATAVNRWHISVRGYHRLLKVARTIADLSGEETISEAALAEALQYRVPTAVTV